MTLRRKIESLANAHERALRENDAEEWDYEKQEPAAIGQGAHSYKLGALAIAREWAAKWNLISGNFVTEKMSLEKCRVIDELNAWSKEVLDEKT